jgi:hypothetical protein
MIDDELQNRLRQEKKSGKKSLTAYEQRVGAAIQERMNPVAFQVRINAAVAERMRSPALKHRLKIMFQQRTQSVDF